MKPEDEAEARALLALAKLPEFADVVLSSDLTVERVREFVMIVTALLDEATVGVMPPPGRLASFPRTVFEAARARIGDAVGDSIVLLPKGKPN